MRAFVKSISPMLITCLAAGTLLAVLAPFGTQGFAPVHRFAYWIGLCLAGGIGAAAVSYYEQRRGIELRPWPMAFLQSVTSALAVLCVILAMSWYYYGKPTLFHVGQTMFYVWVISLAISSIGALIRQGKQAASGDAANDPTRAALYQRLPPKLREAEIYALAAEDHYVRVITSKGEALILIRLSDAVAETAPIKGLSPHRSWWVAEAGAAKVTRSEITLKSGNILSQSGQNQGGQTIPISRTGLKAVKAAGWV